MPKQNNDLFKQVSELRSKADELLIIKAASRKFGVLDQIKQEVAILEKDLESNKQAIVRNEYELSKLDKSHPDYEKQKEQKQEAIASNQVSASNYEARLVQTKGRMVREETRIKKEIKKLEEGKGYLPSQMDKENLVNEMINKLTYGA